MDGFNQLPDCMIMEIFNHLSDVKSLSRCGAVSKRFNSLVPQANSLTLRVDRIDSSDTDSDFPIVNFFRSVIRSFQQLFLLFPKHSDLTLTRTPTRSRNSLAQILTPFEQIRSLEIEIPGGDLRLEKGAVVKWKAEFGSTLKSCVIVAFRSVADSSTDYSVDGGDADAEFDCGLKTRVVWTISALVAASERHFLLREVVKEHKEIEKLVLGDREGEGTLVMDGEGLREFREAEESSVLAGKEKHVKKSRTVVPSVKLSMRHAPRLRLKSGVCLDGATLVVARPCSSATSDMDDAELASAAFGSAGDGGNSGDELYGEAVQALLKCRRNLLEINSF